MTKVALIKVPSLEGKRFSFALAEDRLAHYPEFRDFFRHIQPFVSNIEEMRHYEPVGVQNRK